MKKLYFYIIVAFLTSTVHLDCMIRSVEQRIANIKLDLNQEFGQPDDRDMFVVTVTRTPVASSAPAPLISHNEFEQVLKLLYASTVDAGCCLKRWWHGSDAAVSPTYSRDGVSLNQVIDNPLDIRGIQAIQRSSICSAAQDIGRYFIGNKMSGACKLVVFNEMFFSQLEPLDTDQKNFIERKLFDLSTSSSNAIFYPNFLYTETRHVTGTDVYGDLLRMGRNTRGGLAVIDTVIPGLTAGIVAAVNPSMIFSNTRRALRGCATVIQAAVPNNATHIDWEYLTNETYAIHDGVILTKNRKVGYFVESDAAVQRGVLYSSGSGHDESVVLGVHPLRDKLLRNVTIDLCLDLNLGIRRNSANHWTNPVPVGVRVGARDSSLHFVQSNSINPFYDVTNRENLPKETGVVHADKYPHPSWNVPSSTSRPQNIYLPYIDTVTGNVKDDFLGYKSVFSTRIVDSDYAFSFLKL
jgi:hypothetical protein